MLYQNLSILVSCSFGKVVFAFGRRGSKIKGLTGELRCNIKQKYNENKKTCFAGEKMAIYWW